MRCVIWLGAGMFGMPAVLQNPSSTVVTFYGLLMLCLAGYLVESRMWDRQEKARKKAQREAASAFGEPNGYTFTVPSWWPRQEPRHRTYPPGPSYRAGGQHAGEPPIIDAEVIGEWA